MVHFPGLTRTDLCIQSAVTWFYQDRFPYSEIPGSKPACGSPRLIAACHVLRRLLAPRHPPYALSSLTIKLTQHIAFAGPWMIAHAELQHRAWGKVRLFHIALHSSKKFAVYYTKRGNALAECKCQLPSVVKEQHSHHPLPVGMPPRQGERDFGLSAWSRAIKNPASSAGRFRLYCGPFAAVAARTEVLEARFASTR